MPKAWMTERPYFESRLGQGFLLYVIQTGSGAHPASYLMGRGDLFLEVKAAEA
jgi:hypothetical protein